MARWARVVNSVSTLATVKKEEKQAKRMVNDRQSQCTPGNINDLGLHAHSEIETTNISSATCA